MNDEIELIAPTDSEKMILDTVIQVSSLPMSSIEIYRQLKLIYEQGQKDAISNISDLCGIEISL